MFENLTIYQALKQSAISYPKGMAIYYKGKTISFAKFLKLVDETADILYNRLNIRKGDVVLLSQPNIPDVLTIFFALNKIGAVSNLVHPFTPYNQLYAIYKKTNSKCAIIFEQRVAKEVEKYKEISSQIYVTRIENYLPFFSKIFYHLFMNLRIRHKLGKSFKFSGFRYFHKLKPAGKAVIENQFDNKCTVILHSGSTTGEPKSICHSDKAFTYICSNAEFFISWSFEQIKGCKMLSVLPSFHGFGLEMTMVLPLLTKIGVVLIPKFTPKEVNKALNDTHFRLMCGVPTMYDKLFSDSEFANNSNLKYLHSCFSGGDAMSPTLKNKINGILKVMGSDSMIFEGYGLTEVLAVNAVNTLDYNKEGSVGKLMNDCHVLIKDENNNNLNIGEVGEICLKSDSLMLGYLNDEKATQEAFVDGYLKTGDYGYIDEDGYLFFKNRIKRVIKVSGVAVFPSEVEKLINSIVEVDKAVAIGIPDDNLQSAIKVFVVTSFFDKEEMRQKIMDTCRKYLIRWAVPKEIAFIDDIPLTKLGKIDFKALENM